MERKLDKLEKKIIRISDHIAVEKVEIAKLVISNKEFKKRLPKILSDYDRTVKEGIKVFGITGNYNLEKAKWQTEYNALDYENLPEGEI